MNLRPLLLASVSFAFVATPVLAQNDPFADFAPVTDEMLQNPGPGDWLHWRRTYDNQGYSPLDQINKENVGSLALSWSRAMEPGFQEATPLVHDGIHVPAASERRDPGRRCDEWRPHLGISADAAH